MMDVTVTHDFIRDFKEKDPNSGRQDVHITHTHHTHEAYLILNTVRS